MATVVKCDGTHDQIVVAEYHVTEQGNGDTWSKDYCRTHFIEWLEHKKTGGAKSEYRYSFTRPA